jgi:Na+/melibiose symporter-like transporter
MTALTIAGKVGGSLAPSVLGFVLAYVAFDKANVTALAASGIHAAITLLPALYLALSLAFIAIYPVTRERLEGLRAKRAAEGAKYAE